MKLLDAFKAAFDSLVRTYSPMVIGAALAGLAIVLGIPVPDEVATFVTLLVAVIFQMLWYGVLRIIELVRGKASKILGLGLVQSEPVYQLTKVAGADGAEQWMTRAQYRAHLQALADDDRGEGGDQ